MTAAALLRQLRRRAQSRRMAIDLLLWLPWIPVALFIALRSAGPPAALVVAALAVTLLAARLRWRWRALDAHWLVQALDRRDRRLEDSSDLLLAAPQTLTPLQRLQRSRLEQRVLDQPPDLREAIPGKLSRVSGTFALLLGLVTVVWPPLETAPPASSAVQPPSTIDPGTLQSLQARIEIAPPSYTALPEREVAGLDAEVPAGSVLRWTLQFAVQPHAARLLFLDGEPLELRNEDGVWQAQRLMQQSALYRIELEAAPALPTMPAHRIDVRADQPPQISVLQPERTLTELSAATRHWSLHFDATDDHGLAGAQLILTLAQGSGEQISVSERRIALRGEGSPRQQRFEHRVELSALGFAQGDDLIARIEVRDTRQPTPNVSRSASFILRWPADAGSDGSGVEGLVQQTLPAYFRSQRQIIIDTEALIGERGALDADALLARSDAIGVDQRILRLRYGQFLGEETEDVVGGDAHDEHADDEHAHADDNSNAPNAGAFGEAGDLIAQVGHMHDIPEAATLLDPVTRELLRAALREMWQSELHLRSGAPATALPFEYRALDYIKRVQQADRIYLARVGLELPALDPARRLTGEAARGGRRVDPLVATPPATAPLRMWQALQQGTELPLDDLQRWLRGAGDEVTDPLSLLAQIDGLRRDPGCISCRTRLTEQLWPLLTPPAASPVLRPRADAAGRVYLEALSPPGEMP